MIPEEDIDQFADKSNNLDAEKQDQHCMSSMLRDGEMGKVEADFNKNTSK